MKYTRKAVTIDGWQWTGSTPEEAKKFVEENNLPDFKFGNIKKAVGLIIPTPEGDHIASQGDYVIKGTIGEYYPCKPEVFEQKYVADKETTHANVFKVKRTVLCGTRGAVFPQIYVEQEETEEGTKITIASNVRIKDKDGLYGPVVSRASYWLAPETPETLSESLAQATQNFIGEVYKAQVLGSWDHERVDLYQGTEADRLTRFIEGKPDPSFHVRKIEYIMAKEVPE